MTDMLKNFFDFGPLWSALALGGGVWTTFSWLDTHFSPEAKRGVTVWLRGHHEWTKIQETFQKAFYLTFGRRPLSVQSFMRSAAVSTLTLVVLSIIYITNSPQFWTNDGYLAEIDWNARARYFFLMTVLVNIPSDYISVLITRIFIHWTASTRLIFRIVLYFIFSVTCLLVYLTCTAIVDTTIGFSDSELVFKTTPYSSVEDIFSINNHIAYLEFALKWQPIIYWSGASVTAWYEIFSYGPFVYSSLLTMGWMGLYVICGLIINVLGRSERIWALWIKVFDVEKYPLKCMGVVASVICASTYLFFSAVAKLIP